MVGTLLDISLAIAGFVVLLIGYRRNDRKLLLAAAILLFLTGTLSEFSRGFAASFEQAAEQSTE